MKAIVQGYPLINQWSMKCYLLSHVKILFKIIVFFFFFFFFWGGGGVEERGVPQNQIGAFFCKMLDSLCTNGPRAKDPPHPPPKKKKRLEKSRGKILWGDTCLLNYFLNLYFCFPFQTDDDY